jgi:hypothetical protein
VTATRRRLLDAGIIVPGLGMSIMSIMPWVDEPTLRMDRAGRLEAQHSYPEAPDFFDIERWWNTPLRRSH